jgi:hypothetical protein
MRTRLFKELADHLAACTARKTGREKENTMFIALAFILFICLDAWLGRLPCHLAAIHVLVVLAIREHGCAFRSRSKEIGLTQRVGTAFESACAAVALPDGRSSSEPYPEARRRSRGPAAIRGEGAKEPERTGATVGYRAPATRDSTGRRGLRCPRWGG